MKSAFFGAAALAAALATTSLGSGPVPATIPTGYELPRRRVAKDGLGRRKKPKTRAIRKWYGGAGNTERYALRRNWHRGRSSTLKKTAKRLRLEAGIA